MKGTSPIPLYAAIFLPPLVFVVGGTSSLGTGALLACLVAMAVAPAATQRSLARSGLTYAAMAAGLAAIAAHLLLMGAFYPVNLPRGVGSLLLAVVFVLGALTIVESFFSAAPNVIDRHCQRIFRFMSAALVVGILDLIPAELFGRNKLVFPFSEPSHFALAFAPFLMYSALRARGWGRFWIVLGAFVLAYLIQNLTLVAACFVVAAVCLRPLHLPWLAGLLVLGAASVDLSYFSARLSAGADSENLSSLVFLQGWQLIEESLSRSGQLGLGFQQLGERPTDVLAAALIHQLSELELNLSDGGFLVSKLVSEFGVFGMLIVAAATVNAFLAASRLRKAADQGAGTDPAQLLSDCVMLAFLLDLYVRGTGYFSGTSLLFISALAYRWSRRGPQTAPRAARLNAQARASMSSS